MPDLNIQPQTTFRDIQRSFSGLGRSMDGKHLRLDEGGRGMHLHDTGKLSGIGAKAAERRAMKHDLAFEAVAKAIDEQLGGIEGAGKEILRSVLGTKNFDRKLISVKDLGRIGDEVAKQEVKQTMRDALVKVTMESLEGKIDNEDLLKEVSKQLRSNHNIDLGEARRVFEGMEKLGLGARYDAMLQDMRSGMGPLQVFAKHGLTDESIGTDREGIEHVYANKPESEFLKYGNLEQNPKAQHGAKIETRTFHNFIVCRTPGLTEREDDGELQKSGDKLHISVNKEQVAKAWDTVVPILLEFPDVCKEFKVTDMFGTTRESWALEDQVKKLDTREMNGNILSNKEQQDLHNAKQDLARAQRVIDGSQISLYFHKEGEEGSVPMERSREMVDKINKALKEAGVKPGERPESDHNVNDYVSYRFEIRDNPDDEGFGAPLLTDSNVYEEYKKDMVNRPFFKALTG